MPVNSEYLVKVEVKSPASPFSEVVLFLTSQMHAGYKNCESGDLMNRQMPADYSRNSIVQTGGCV